MKVSQPDKFVLYLLHILINGLKNYELSAILLRSSFTAIERPESFIWTKLNPETQRIVKEALIKSLFASGTNANIRNKICMVTSELLGTLADYDEIWVEALNAIEELISFNDDDDKKIAGLKLIAETFPYLGPEYTNNLHGFFDIFQKSLANDSIAVRKMCMKAINAIIPCIGDDAREEFETLVPLIAHSMEMALNSKAEAELKSLITDLTSLADTNPRFFKKGFTELFKIGIEIAKTNFENQEIPGLIIEMIVTSLEGAPSLFLQENLPQETGEYYSKLFSMILWLMHHYSKDFDPDWVHPNSSMDPSDDDYLLLGQRAIDRILACTRREFGLDLLGQQVLTWLNQSKDWRIKRVSFLAGARIGPFIHLPNELSIFVPLLSKYAIKSEDPKVRFSAVQALRNLSEDSDDVLYFNCHKEVIETLISVLSDKVGRIRLEGCIALKSFIEKMDNVDLSRYIGQIMDMSIALADSGIPPINEVAITIIGTLAEVSPETFRKQYYYEIMPSIMENLGSIDKTHKGFRGKTIETISIIANSVGKIAFKDYFPKLAKVMVEIQRTQLKSKDPEKIYLLSSWQRICKLYNTDLAPFVDEIIPSIIELSAPSVHPYMNGGVHIEDNDEKEQALSLLSVMIESLNVALEKYVPQIEELLIGVLEIENNDIIKSPAAVSLKNLIVAMSKKGNIEDIAKKSLVTLIKTIKTDKSLNNIESEITAVRDILYSLQNPCFNETELLEVFGEVMSFASDSNTRQILLKESQGSDEGNSNDLEREENILALFGQSIGALIKSHPNEFTELFHLIYPKLLKENLESPSSTSQIIFSLTIIAEGLRYLTYSRIPSIYKESTELIMKFVTDVHPKIRAVALEGLAAAVSGADVHSVAITNQCFEYIKRVIITPMPEQVSRKEWNAVKERAIISLSNMIISQKSDNSSKTTEMIMIWLKYLPLKQDIIQGKNQINILSQMMTANLVVVTGSNGENLKELIRLIMEVLDTNQINKDISERFLKGLKEVMTQKQWEGITKEAYESLPKVLQVKMENYLI